MNAVLLVLVMQLGSSDFKTREAASAALERMGADSLLYLEIAEHASDREIAARAKLLLDRWYCRNAERIANGLIGKKSPWIAWEGEDIDDGYWLVRARKQIGQQGPPHWNDYRLATRLLITQMVRSRCLEGVDAVLAECWRQERAWMKAHGQNYKLPD